MPKSPKPQSPTPTSPTLSHPTTRLANIADLHEGVNTLTINNRRLFLYKEGEILKLYDGVCPHQGGRLHEGCGEIYCKVHDWRFDAKSGESSNIQNARLFALECYVDARGDIYQAEGANATRHDGTRGSGVKESCVPSSCQNTSDSTAPEVHSPCSDAPSVSSAYAVASPSFTSASLAASTPLASTSAPLDSPHPHFPKSLKITLHSHASLEFAREDFSLLCDPWLEGLAFFGAWRHYPAPCVRAADLKPSALWISHEHSDHFHAPTLRALDKNIPVYIPSFPNHRLEDKLAELGFKRIIPLEFGARIEIAKDFFITTYEPASLWNDAQILLEIDGFRILNINDAGINHRIHAEVKRVDCIASAFSPGASGYPATHTHLDDARKVEIYEQSRTATLEMLQEACALYGAQYFLPFASHFILNHPRHLSYMRLVKKNTIFDVMEKFSGSGVEVIDLLAGDVWRVDSGVITRREREENLYSPERVFASIKEDFSEAEFEEYYPARQKYVWDREVALKYFQQLNQIPEMAFCEDMSVSVYPDFSESEAFSFEVRGGVLELLDSVIATPNLTIKIPSEILMYICKHNESWDEATIGYWCEFSRNPDVYHTEFWRILQAPYYLKTPAVRTPKDDAPPPIGLESNLAEVIEKLDSIGLKIMGRYGLYCQSCHKAPMETLEQACGAHGINPVRMQRLVKELNVHYASLQK